MGDHSWMALFNGPPVMSAGSYEGIRENPRMSDLQTSTYFTV